MGGGGGGDQRGKTLVSKTMCKVRSPYKGRGGGARVVVSTAAFHEFRVRFPVSAV